MYDTMTIVSTALWYMGKLRESVLRVLITEITFSLFIFFSLHLFEKTDISCNCYGKYFTIHVNQTIMLYDLNLYSKVCQLFLNKTGKNISVKKKPINIFFPCVILSEVG